METIYISQEILIVHNSRFFSKELNEKEKFADSKKFPQNEQVADACWNGLLKETLPEISTNLPLIRIKEYNSFLELRFGDYNQHIQRDVVLNPYIFLQEIRLN
ncbi:MAG: hypothetical protein ABI172_05840 [Ginsengibacter sp.]|jgi:hypothetical protein